MDAHGRFITGGSSYPNDNGVSPRPLQAFLYDVQLKDGEGGDDHCAGFVEDFALGFLNEDYGGGEDPLLDHRDDNYSQGLAISTVNPDDDLSRAGLVVGGYSMKVNSTGGALNQERAVIWFLDDGYYPPDYTVYDRFNLYVEIHDLKTYLQGQEVTGLDDWELREVTGISDNGKIITGWGLHDGVEEGFVVYLDPTLVPAGACCHLPDPCADNKRPFECKDLYGEDAIWQGANTTCANQPCCHHPFADADGDGDVDQMDFAAFQNCYTGTYNAESCPLCGGVPPGCECWNRNGDTDITAADFAEFNNCWTGPNVKYSDVTQPAVNPCVPDWPTP
jgi:hypothetical protein